MNPSKQKTRKRLRRRRHVRKKVFGTAQRPRLSVSRSLRNIACQAIDDERGVTLTSASSLCEELRGSISGGSRSGAALVGRLVAQRAKDLGIGQLAFDRNGYRYHGRVAALAEAVRKEGIEV